MMRKEEVTMRLLAEGQPFRPGHPMIFEEEPRIVRVLPGILADKTGTKKYSRSFPPSYCL